MSYPTQQNIPPPQEGFAPPPGYAPPSYQAATGYTTVIEQPRMQPLPSGCPKCGREMRDEFTCCGILLAILFFPIGIICCVLMTEKRCGSCDAVHVHSDPGYVPIYHHDPHIHHHPHPRQPFHHHHQHINQPHHHHQHHQHHHHAGEHHHHGGHHC